MSLEHAVPSNIHSKLSIYLSKCKSTYLSIYLEDVYEKMSLEHAVPANIHSDAESYDVEDEMDVTVEHGSENESFSDDTLSAQSQENYL